MNVPTQNLSWAVGCRLLQAGPVVVLTVLVWLLPRVEAGAFIAKEPPGDLSRLWAFETGVAFITSNNVDDFLHGRVNVAGGDAGGQVYQITASRLLHQFQWNTRWGEWRPQLELPLTLEIIDEFGRSAFLDYNTALTARWVDFPWNDHVYTTFSMGVGLSYSSRVMEIDKARHPDRDRSHLKFHWPIQFTLARPETPHHQLLFFLAHQSGGHVFDRGGVNSLGIGYRLGFE